MYGLHNYVKRVQRKYITLENVIAEFVDANSFGVQLIKDSCLDVIGKDLKKLLEEIEELPEDMLVRMFRGLIVKGVSLWACDFSQSDVQNRHRELPMHHHCIITQLHGHIRYILMLILEPDLDTDLDFFLTVYKVTNLCVYLVIEKVGKLAIWAF